MTASNEKFTWLISRGLGAVVRNRTLLLRYEANKVAAAFFEERRQRVTGCKSWCQYPAGTNVSVCGLNHLFLLGSSAKLHAGLGGRESTAGAGKQRTLRGGVERRPLQHHSKQATRYRAAEFQDVVERPQGSRLVWLPPTGARSS